MRYRFVDEIVSLALDGAPRIEVAKRFGGAGSIARARLMFVCLDVPGVDVAQGVGP